MNNTLGYLGNDFFETITCLFDYYTRNELTRINMKTIKEYVEYVQYRFDLQMNNRIPKIITTKLPIFEKGEKGYHISGKFEKYGLRFSHTISRRKHDFFVFCFQECVDARAFKDYCQGLFHLSKIIPDTTNAIIEKHWLKIIGRELGNNQKSVIKLLQDLDVVITHTKDNLTFDLKMFQGIIDDLDLSYKIIRENVNEEYKVMDRPHAYELLKTFGFYRPEEIIELLRFREKICVRGTRSGFYLDFT
jgi:hypothetical protein